LRLRERKRERERASESESKKERERERERERGMRWAGSIATDFLSTASSAAVHASCAGHIPMKYVTHANDSCHTHE